MEFEPNYRRPFSLFVKKQYKPFQAVIEDEVVAVCTAPDIGEAKTGDLVGISVHKFTYQRQLYLMAYHAPKVKAIVDCTADEEPEGLQFVLIDFYQLGTHENFYNDLRAYLKADGWYK